MEVTILEGNSTANNEKPFRKNSKRLIQLIFVMFCISLLKWILDFSILQSL